MAAKGVLLLVFLTFALVGCDSDRERKGELYSFTGLSMTMHYRVVVGQPLPEGAIEAVGRLIEDTFNEVDTYYNIWNRDSELSRLNRSEGGRWHPLSPQLESFLLFTDGMVKLTDGAFDPTITPAYRLWTGKLSNNSLPTEEELRQIRDVVGWDKVKIEGRQFWKESDALAIDLGGIAKGYCVDLITERLVEMGYKSCYVEWGGEIRTSGLHPEGRPWRVYISHLSDSSPERALAFIDMVDDSLATSGDYLQQWHFDSGDGVKMTYSHIIDPRSLRPIEVTEKNICSATVKAKKCAVADALATAALLCATVEEAKGRASRWGEVEELSCWFVTRDSLDPLATSP